MPKSGPILIIEDDLDDQEILKEVFDALQVPNVLRFFATCNSALDYLHSTLERPFLIISDINLPAMTGIQLKKEINGNEVLSKKCIPFIFLSTAQDEYFISSAYEVQVQGYFVKPPRLIDLKLMMSHIVGYWKFSQNPGYPYAVMVSSK
jgi:CheY-like chemotaxis protein